MKCCPHHTEIFPLYSKNIQTGECVMDLVNINAIKCISHKYISSLHLKRDLTHADAPENVLIIETINFKSNFSDLDTYECLMELLTDLDNLRIAVEEQVGKFDRIDIRCH
jgi:hypothetical protein